MTSSRPISGPVLPSQLVKARPRNTAAASPAGLRHEEKLLACIVPPSRRSSSIIDLNGSKKQAPWARVRRAAPRAGARPPSARATPAAAERYGDVDRRRHVISGAPTPRRSSGRRPRLRPRLRNDCGPGATSAGIGAPGRPGWVANYGPLVRLPPGSAARRRGPYGSAHATPRGAGPCMRQAHLGCPAARRCAARDPPAGAGRRTGRPRAGWKAA